MEASDPDDLRNDDGDEVVDPPHDWAEADRISERGEADESLDDKLAAEQPDVTEVEPKAAAEEPDVTGGRHQGQVSGTPEDGDSYYDVVE
ncbi:hypothetical protein [Mycolicibacterium agri]|nr:hypothetical protein [Mycolicibacterium agri]